MYVQIKDNKFLKNQSGIIAKINSKGKILNNYYADNDLDCFIFNYLCGLVLGTG